MNESWCNWRFYIQIDNTDRWERDGYYIIFCFGKTALEQVVLNLSPACHAGLSNFKWNYWPKFVGGNYFPHHKISSDYCSNKLKHGKSFSKGLHGVLKNKLIFLLDSVSGNILNPLMDLTLNIIWLHL